MACTLLLPQKYTGNVEGLAFGEITGDKNQYCISSMYQKKKKKKRMRCFLNENLFRFTGNKSN